MRGTIPGPMPAGDTELITRVLEALARAWRDVTRFEASRSRDIRR